MAAGKVNVDIQRNFGIEQSKICKKLAVQENGYSLKYETFIELPFSI